MADIDGLIAGLGSHDVIARRRAVWALGEAIHQGAETAAAIPALAKLLYDGDTPIRSYAAGALMHVALSCDVTAAVPALANALSDRDALVRVYAVEALKRAVEKCASTEPLDAIEAEFLKERGESYGYWIKKEPARVLLSFSSVANVIAKKRNSLASQRDILLTDKVKPPKCGTIFQATRRALANG